MRENSGLSGRVSTKLKAGLVALLAVFAFSAVSAASANAAPIKMTFDDAWIKVDALYALTGPLHAVDPADGKNLKIEATGDLKEDGSFTVKQGDFKFPDQEMDNPINPNGAPLVLSIAAASDFNGTFDPATGALSTQLPLSLRVNLPGMVDCSISPLNIGLASTGVLTFPDHKGEAVPSQTATPFNGAGGAGAAVGDWTGVGINDVKGNATDTMTAEEMTEACQGLIGGLIGIDDNPDASFDGSIWLGGTVVGQLPAPECPAGQTGTPPNCKPEVTVKPGKVGKITVTPKKAKVKRGKVAKLRVKITNTGGKVLKTKIKIKSSNKRVKAPKAISVSVKPGKAVTKVIKVKAAKKAKGKAKITASVGKKKGVATLTVRK